MLVGIGERPTLDVDQEEAIVPALVDIADLPLDEARAVRKEHMALEAIPQHAFAWEASHYRQAAIATAMLAIVTA